jgi:hypothetical protein
MPLAGLEDGPLSGIVGVHVGKGGIGFMVPTCSMCLTQKLS